MRGVTPPPTITLAMRGWLLSPMNGRARTGDESVTAARASHRDPDTVICAPSGYDAASRYVIGVPGSYRGIGRYSVECCEITGLTSGRFSRSDRPIGDGNCPASKRMPMRPGRS